MVDRFDDEGVEILDMGVEFLDINETVDVGFDNDVYNDIDKFNQNDFKLNNSFNQNNFIDNSNLNALDKSSDFNGSSLSNMSSGVNNFNLNTIEELNNMKNLLLIRNEYPNKQINYDFNYGVYVLSEPGFSDQYVNVVDGKLLFFDINSSFVEDDSSKNENSLKNSKSLSKTKSTLAGRMMSFDDNVNKGFTNMLFFIFLAGLSVGVIFMVILNFFVK